MCYWKIFRNKGANMPTNYKKVISQLCLRIASLEANNAILEDQIEQYDQIINDQKLKHPEDFPADKQGGDDANAEKVHD